MKGAVIIGYLAFFFFTLGAALNVSSCNNGEKGLNEIKQDIAVGRCKTPPCRFRKGSFVPAYFKFTPALDTPTLVNSVSALIVGIPFPFIGVDGTDACKSIYKEDGETLVGCPLKKGETYVYKDKFDVLSIYPRIKLIVHWGLIGNSGAHVLCFEVPARITN